MQTQTTIDEARLARVEVLLKGAHEPPNGTFAACAMEAVAYVAGEKWSDHPECVSPVIGGFMRSWNDGLPNDADRTRLLLPLIPKIINTRDEALERRRATMAADWLIRGVLMIFGISGSKQPGCDLHHSASHRSMSA